MDDSPSWCRGVVCAALLVTVFSFLVLFLDIEFALVRRDEHGALMSFFTLGRMVCARPRDLATVARLQRLDDAERRRHASTSPLFTANMSFALYAARLPRPARSFLLALPHDTDIDGGVDADSPPLYADDFAARGVRHPLTTVVVYTALHRALRRNNNSSCGVGDEASGVESMLVIDVGAGSGYYTALAASMGFATLSFDANAFVQPYLQTTLFVNGWHDDGRHLVSIDSSLSSN